MATLIEDMFRLEKEHFSSEGARSRLRTKLGIASRGGSDAELRTNIQYSFVDARNIALKNLKEGLTLEGNIGNIEIDVIVIFLSSPFW